MTEPSLPPPGDHEADPKLGKMNRLLRQAMEQDDRGLVLSICAFAEDALRRLLMTYLRPGQPAIDLVEGFNAPLGTLSARIKACAALGLLTHTQFKDLELARKIRNEFAHDWEPCSLSSSGVHALIEKMTDDRFLKRGSTSPRNRFYSAMSCLLFELESLRDRLESESHRLPPLAFEVVAGGITADFRASEE